MYRVSPFTYLVEGILSTAVANTPVVCRPEEYLQFAPGNGQTCGDYMAPYISFAGGYLQDKSATDMCSFCLLDNTNTFLSAFSISYANRWRDFGLLFVYIIFNVAAAIGLYWLARVVSIPLYAPLQNAAYIIFSSPRSLARSKLSSRRTAKRHSLRLKIRRDRQRRLHRRRSHV